MTSSTSTLSLGRALFRFRSFTPVPVIAALLWLLWRSRGAYGPGGALVDGVLDVAGVALALAGQALRFYTLGQVPEGTSGQGNALEAATLNTQGPYAHVRNPLYVGNLGICLGLMLVAHDVAVYVLGLLFFFGEYFFIIRAEEDFLRARFGDAFDAYCARVRRWVPRLRPAYEGKLRMGFDLWRALRKEHNPFAAWATGAIALIAWERWARGGWSDAWLVGLGALELAVVVSFVLIKGLKHGWFRRGAA